MSQTILPHPPRPTMPWLLAFVSLCLLALFLSLAFNLAQPITVTVDGSRIKLRTETTIGELENSGAIAAHPGRLLSVEGGVLSSVGGEPPHIVRNGRPVSESARVYDGDTISSTSGADSIEATVAVREPIQVDTVIQGRGPVLRLASPGSVGVLERVMGEVSRIVVTQRVVTAAQPMVIVRTSPSPTEKLIALTFDDGPWPGQTDKILKILKAENVHATFFMVGIRVNMAPALARQVVKDGNLVGSHTLSHKELTKVSGKELTHQIEGGIDAVYRATGFRPTWFRPSYGAVNAAFWKETRRLGLHVALWDIDPRDWSRPGVKHIVSVVEKHAHRGAVILMHDGGSDRKQTIAALPKVIEELKKRGYVFVTLEELAAAR